jgi:hypothetical protein
MRARIYQKPRNAMQSGQAGTESWMLEYETDNRAQPDPLMGWIGGGSTLSQLRLTFATRDEAVAYADKRGLSYDRQLPLRPAGKLDPLTARTIPARALSSVG